MISLFLRDIEKVAERKDITKLESLIHQILTITPIPRVELASGLEVQRIRNNYHGEIFYSESELSFRKDIENIREFGRCNFPNTPKFYCSLSSKYIRDIRITNVLETNKVFRNNLSIRKRQIFTSGKWICKTPLIVAIFPFSKYARGLNTEIELHASKYENIINSLQKNDKEIARKLLPFISHFLSRKKIAFHWDYLISAFFSELILDKYNLDGILYPSVRTNYKSYNLVLQPWATNKFEFVQAAMFELFLNRKKAFIDNVANGQVTDGYKILWSQLKSASDKELQIHLK